MTYTFISAARTINPSVVEAETVEAGAVALSETDTPEAWAALMASGIAIADNEPLPPAPYSLSKFEFIGRMTDDEATAFEAALAASPVKERLAFQNAASLDSAAPLFAVFRSRLETLLGRERAAELLAAP